MDNNRTLLETLELQGKQAEQLVKQTEAMKSILTEVTNLKKDVDEVAVKTEGRLKEVETLVEEVNKKVHIDDVEASTIKSIIGRRAYHYAKEFFEKEGTLPSQNLFSSKKGQFIRIQHSRLKKYFNVTKYTHIKHTDAERAFDFLKTLSFDDFTAFETRETPKQKEIRALEMQLLA